MDDTPKLSLVSKTPPADAQDLLPALIQKLNVVIPEPIYTDHNVTLGQVKQADIMLFNTQLAILHASWQEVKSISTALSLVKQTSEMIKLRRDILGLEYGAPKDNSINKTFAPLD